MSALLLGAAGCTVHTDDSPPPEAPPRVVEYRTVPAPAPAPAPTVVYVYGHRADPVNAPPAGWRGAPRVVYRGSDAYWIGGRWYFKTDAGLWIVFREEPRELERRRIEMRRAPEYAYPRY